MADGGKDSRVRAVGIGEGRTGRSGDGTLAIYGLGSCVALCLFDERAGVGGMCHVALPTVQMNRPGDTSARFGDAAASWLLGQMKLLGASPRRVVAKLAGGASIFPARPPLSSIGMRNVETVRAALVRLAIPVTSEDVGGTAGRTVFFHLSDGRLEVYLSGSVAVVL